MPPQTSKLLIGAVVAAALAFAVYYGLISQQTANSIQTQANQTLQTGPASQQTGVGTQNPPTQSSSQTGTVAPNAATTPRQ